MMRKQLMKIFSERMHKLDAGRIFSIVVPAYSSLDFYNVAGHIIFLIAGSIHFMLCAGIASHDPDNPNYKTDAWHDTAIYVMSGTWFLLMIRFAAQIFRWYILHEELLTADSVLSVCVAGRWRSYFTSVCNCL